MKFLYAVIISVAILAGCTAAGSKPPAPTVNAGKLVVPVVLGTHCWSRGCADYPTPPRQLKAEGYTPTVVPPGAVLGIHFATPPKDGVLTMNQWAGDQATTLSQSAKNSLAVPTAPGVYTYDVWASWKQGSASWVFQVEVR